MAQLKRSFGTAIQRILRGGVRLSDLEYQLLEAFVHRLPDALAATVGAQLEAYALVQREADGRALNFYPARFSQNLPKLPVKDGEAKLMGFRFWIEPRTEDLYATFAAIDGRFFCAGFSRDLRPYNSAKLGGIDDVVQSWRSAIIGKGVTGY